MIIKHNDMTNNFFLPNSWDYYVSNSNTCKVIVQFDLKIKHEVLKVKFKDKSNLRSWKLKFNDLKFIIKYFKYFINFFLDKILLHLQSFLRNTLELSYSVYMIIHFGFEFIIHFGLYISLYSFRIALKSPGRTKHVCNLRWTSILSKLEKSINF